jgi:hypothetical protein
MLDVARTLLDRPERGRRARDPPLQPRPQAPELSREEFLERWTASTSRSRSGCPGLRGYAIHILDGEAPPYDGIAITTFDSREDAERAFRRSGLAEGLARTRDEFAASVEVYFTREHVVVEEER